MLDDIEKNKNTRERILMKLQANPSCTIIDLAGAVDINPISVRHHIARLEAEGLVTSQEERHGVGRPRRMYSLTDKGRESFPTRYLRLTLRLLEQLKETLPKAMVSQLFSQIAQEMASDYDGLLDNLSIEERLNLIKRLLTEEGFTLDWERRGDHYLIRELNCPYFHIGQAHPEVCSLDQTLISTLLSTPAEKTRCMLHGDSQCTFMVTES